jgi:hypothetical protein
VGFLFMLMPLLERQQPSRPFVGVALEFYLTHPNDDPVAPKRRAWALTKKQVRQWIALGFTPEPRLVVVFQNPAPPRSP